MNDDIRFAQPQCRLCKHLVEGISRVCPAFPGVIPRDVWNNETDHVTPYPNQEGETVFEARADADQADLDLLSVILADTPQGRQRADEQAAQTIASVLGLKKPGIQKGKP